MWSVSLQPMEAFVLLTTAGTSLLYVDLLRRINLLISPSCCAVVFRGWLMNDQEAFVCSARYFV